MANIKALGFLKLLINFYKVFVEDTLIVHLVNWKDFSLLEWCIARLNAFFNVLWKCRFTFFFSGITHLFIRINSQSWRIFIYAWLISRANKLVTNTTLLINIYFSLQWITLGHKDESQFTSFRFEYVKPLQ